MKLISFVTALLFSVSAFADFIFPTMAGTYSVDVRTCEKGDTACVNLKSITVGVHDDGDLEDVSFVTETYKDGTQTTYNLWEGKIEDEEAFITGTVSTDASWTRMSKVGDEKVFEGITLWRTIKGAPLRYKYDLTKRVADKTTERIVRNYKMK